MMTKITNGSNLVLFWTQSSKVCCFRKAQKETKGIMQKEGRQVGKQDPHSSLLGGRQVCRYLFKEEGAGFLPCLIAPSTQVHRFQKMSNTPFFCPQLFLLFGSRTKETFSRLPFSSFPFHSLFLKKMDNFLFSIFVL